MNTLVSQCQSPFNVKLKINVQILITQVYSQKSVLFNPDPLTLLVFPAVNKIELFQHPNAVQS